MARKGVSARAAFGLAVKRYVMSLRVVSEGHTGESNSARAHTIITRLSTRKSFMPVEHNQRATISFL